VKGELVHKELIHLKNENETVPARRSLLELNMEILRVVAHHGSIKMTHIMHKANVNNAKAKACLDFLVRQNLVELTPRFSREKCYSITERGINVIRFFQKIMDLFPQN
jgi:predicted transcriptional regulator